MKVNTSAAYKLPINVDNIRAKDVYIDEYIFVIIVFLLQGNYL